MAAGALVILLIGIAAGILVVPGHSTPAPVQVSSVQFTLVQGTNASGNPWFGPSPVIYQGIQNGYPYSISPGKSFTVPLVLENFDTQSHTIYSISAAAPFTFTGSDPAAPVLVPAGTDDALLQLTFTAPSSAGSTLTLFVTINFLGPST
ncbi:MAG: hypothetical protein ACREDE_03860 [Thermoplasmata archaeon]